MISLKALPIRYAGELQQVQLINFTVDESELKGLIPQGIQPFKISRKASHLYGERPSEINAS